MKKEFQMSEDDLKELYECAKPVPYIIIAGRPPQSPQEKANAFWERLGKKMGFNSETARPVGGKPDGHFTAEAPDE